MITNASGSTHAQDLAAMVKEMTEDHMRIFKAGHDAGYAEGYRDALAEARKLVEAAIPKVTPLPPCERCAQFEEVHDQNCPDHPDYDPTPYCSACGARKRSDCHCGPLASND